MADAHQPCHGGRLYAERIFPTGDRGGNSIKFGTKGNLHSTWDNLLGGGASASGVLRRVQELKDDKEVVERVKAQKARNGTTTRHWYMPLAWVVESQELAKEFVYAEPVMAQVNLAVRGVVIEVHIDMLPDSYFDDAGGMARIRATQAAYRLWPILDEALP